MSFCCHFDTSPSKVSLFMHFVSEWIFPLKTQFAVQSEFIRQKKFSKTKRRSVICSIFFFFFFLPNVLSPLRDTRKAGIKTNKTYKSKIHSSKDYATGGGIFSRTVFRPEVVVCFSWLRASSSSPSSGVIEACIQESCEKIYNVIHMTFKFGWQHQRFFLSMKLL